MKTEVKRKSFIYNGLGFPIRLINVPMRKVLGEWAIDINFNALQLVALNMIVRKATTLTGGELRFIMGYLGLSTRKFSQLFDVTHVAVLKWLKEEVRMNPNTEICLRLYLLDHLKVTDTEFRALYLDLRQRIIAGATSEESYPLEIDAEKIAC